MISEGKVKYIKVVLNLPLIGMWIQVLKVPFRLLFPVIILVCLVGVYSINNSVFGIWVMLIFGVIGYFLKKYDYEFAPLVLAYVLGPMLENSLRQSLIMSKGSFSIFFARPISGTCFAIAVILLIVSAASHSKGWIKRRRQRSSSAI